MYQREFMENSVENMKPDWLTLLFTCNGVGVVIRSVRLKIWSSENSILKKKMETFWFFWLWFCHTSDFTSNSNFWFSLSHKHSCGSPYDFDSDFAASENQPLLGNSRKYPYQTTDVFNVLSPPCLRKFQNVLPPPCLQNSIIVNHPSPSEFPFFWKYIFYLATPIWTNEHEFMPPQGCDLAAPGDKLYSNLPLVARLCKLLFRSEFGYKNKHH